MVKLFVWSVTDFDALEPIAWIKAPWENLVPAPLMQNNGSLTSNKECLTTKHFQQVTLEVQGSLGEISEFFTRL